MNEPERTVRAVRAVEADLRARLQELLDDGRLAVGRELELKGRHFRVTGFDPVSVRPRGVYVQELETGTRTVVEFPGEE